MPAYSLQLQLAADTESDTWDFSGIVEQKLITPAVQSPYMAFAGNDPFGSAVIFSGGSVKTSLLIRSLKICGLPPEYVFCPFPTSDFNFIVSQMSLGYGVQSSIATLLATELQPLSWDDRGNVPIPPDGILLDWKNNPFAVAGSPWSFGLINMSSNYQSLRPPVIPAAFPMGLVIGIETALQLSP